jgi:hypothetical protein
MNAGMETTCEEKATGISAEQKGASEPINVVSSLCRKLDPEQVSRLTRISPAGHGDK